MIRKLVRPSALLTIALTASLALLAPGMASADTTLNFEQYPPGTVLTNQYADFGGPGQGVTFGPLPSGAGDSARPTIQSAPGQAPSGTQVANINCATCNEGLGSTPDTTGTFAVPRSHVSVYVGYLGTPAICPAGNPNNACAFVTLSAFDSNGSQVGAPATARVIQGQSFGQISVSTASDQIVGFEVKARDADSGKPIAIDDLSFDTPSKPPPPDFTLTPATSNVNVIQGTSASDGIAIGRLSGSAGDIQLTASGLPAGVHAQFSPNPASGGSSTLTLSADANAPPTAGVNPTITITGTPSAASAGATPHTFALTVGVQAAFSVSVHNPTDVSLSTCTVPVQVAVGRQPSFAGPVSLSVTGLPAGVQASFHPAQITFPGGGTGQTSTLTLTAPANGFTSFRRTATIHASAPPFTERTATFTVGGTCPRSFQAQITSMQITQGTQLPFLPVRNPSFPGSPIPYSTIEKAAQPGTQQAAARLRAGRWTVVRVYADLHDGPSDGLVVPMVLHGYRFNGIGARVELPGSPISPTYSPSVLRTGPDQPTTGDEGDDTAAYEFTLPSSWTQGQLEVIANLMPMQSGQPVPVATQSARPAAIGGLQPPVYAPCTTADCELGYTFGLRDIPFHDAAPIRIRPVALVVKGDNTLPDPDTAFHWARNESPLSLQIEPYATSIDITDLVGQKPGDALNTMNDRVGHYVCNHGSPPGYPFAAWDIGIAGHHILHGRSNVVATWCWGFPESGTNRFAVVDSDAPGYSVPHELFHLLGRGHASAACGGANNDVFLNLGFAITNHEDWAPDQSGYFQSVGLAPENSSTIAPYHVIFGPPPAGDLQSCPDGTSPCPTNATDWFDFMSYCGSREFLDDPLIDGVWVSVHNWNGVFDAYGLNSADRPAPDVVRARAGPARAPSLYVTASIADSGAVTITGVGPVSAPPMTDTGFDYRLVGIDAAGQTRSDVTMTESFAHADGQPIQRTLQAVVPAAGVATVEIVHGGAVLARRQVSADPPTVSLHGLPAARGGMTIVRWSARDADRDPLEVEVDYSGDGGTTWVPVWMGPNRGEAIFPARYLFSAPRARLRVRVNDGFQTTTATSRRFRSLGAPPVASILMPSRGLRQPNDAPLVLSGEAFDDHSRPLAGRRLHWMLGPRLLGTGNQIAVAGLPAGARRIYLLARDSSGRVGRASLLVHLRPARPLFLALRAPRAVGRKARSLRLRVASSLAATLVVRLAGGRAQRYAIGRRTVTVTVHLPRGHGKLTLRLSLRAGGLSRTMRVTVRRR